MRLEIAEVISFWANWTLVGALLVGVIATYGIVVSGNVKEGAAATRIAELKEETARLSANAEASRAAIAEANARAIKAELELEKFRAPRTISLDQQNELYEEFRKYAGQKYSFNVFSDPEPIRLMRLLAKILERAGWVRIGSQIGAIEIEGAGTASDSGVQVGIRPDSPKELRQLAVDLADALSNVGLTSQPALISDLKIVDALNINVGKKP